MGPFQRGTQKQLLLIGGISMVWYGMVPYSQNERTFTMPYSSLIPKVYPLKGMVQVDNLSTYFSQEYMVVIMLCYS
jgi:hypothetical protein